MEKVTKSHIYAIFIRLANHLNKTVYINNAEMGLFLKENAYFPKPTNMASAWNEVGSWHLDYASCYGGWHIVEADTVGGGIDHPLGSRRYKTREFWDILHYALATVDLCKLDLIKVRKQA